VDLLKEAVPQKFLLADCKENSELFNQIKFYPLIPSSFVCTIFSIFIIFGTKIIIVDAFTQFDWMECCSTLLLVYKNDVLSLISYLMEKMKLVLKYT